MAIVSCVMFFINVFQSRHSTNYISSPTPGSSSSLDAYVIQPNSSSSSYIEEESVCSSRHASLPSVDTSSSSYSPLCEIPLIDEITELPSSIPEERQSLPTVATLKSHEEQPVTSRLGCGNSSADPPGASGGSELAKNPSDDTVTVEYNYKLLKNRDLRRLEGYRDLGKDSFRRPRLIHSKYSMSKYSMSKESPSPVEYTVRLPKRLSRIIPEETSPEVQCSQPCQNPFFVSWKVSNSGLLSPRQIPLNLLHQCQTPPRHQ